MVVGVSKLAHQLCFSNTCFEFLAHDAWGVKRGSESLSLYHCAEFNFRFLKYHKLKSITLNLGKIKIFHLGALLAVNVTTLALMSLLSINVTMIKCASSQLRVLFDVCVMVFINWFYCVFNCVIKLFGDILDIFNFLRVFKNLCTSFWVYSNILNWLRISI